MLHYPATLTADPDEVVRFWRDAGPGLWFAKDADFDRAFRDRFLDLHAAAAGGKLGAWLDTPEGALALVILLDQFPRNAFRGSPAMYGSDAIARAAAASAIAAGHDRAIEPGLRLFLYMPLAHSEDSADQDRSVALCAALGEPSAGRSWHHRDLVRRFGRFPHRNAILGRAATPAEAAFLAGGGYAG